MKKGVFLVMLCCGLTGSLCAQNKRLSKIVENRLSNETTVQFKYDNQDRVVQMQISGGGKMSVADFTYDESEVRINHQYSSGTDTYVYHLADNKLQSSEIFLDVDNLFVSTYMLQLPDKATLEKFLRDEIHD